MGQFCCKCGKSDLEEKIIDGFCLSCYSEEFPLILSFPEKQFNVTACKLCGDLMYHGTWQEVFEEPKEVLLDFLDEFISKTKKIKDTKKVLVKDFEEPLYDVASKQSITVLFEGTPKKEVPPYQQEVDIDLVINIGVCERCAKFTRGYFESIVQIRSDKRPINEEEQLLISSLIQQKKEEALGGDRMAYISKVVDQSKGGIDLYIGSEKFAKQIATFLAEHLAASIEYSTKLKSVKDGKPLYQSTYCVRVPYFEVGDVVEYQGYPYQIMGINFGRVEIFNFKNQETKTLSLKESHPDHLRVLKKQDQFQKYIIAAIQPPNVSIMNEVTFETIDVDVNVLYQEHQEGDEILMVELPEGFFECREL